MSTKPSLTSKLIQAAALAAVLVPLGSVAVETSPITHSYSGLGTANPANNQLFDFGPYEFRLNFENLFDQAGFAVTVNNVPANQASVNPRLGSFAGFLCVPLDPGAPGAPCVDFFVTAPDPGPFTWTGFYDIFISWDANTDPAFPNTPGDRIRILHNEGNIPGNGFDSDITTPGSYFSGLDPAIGGRDDNFQSFMVTQRPTAANVVPEPATLFLVTSGVSGLLYRRRRKRQNSEGR
jgi:PEP-CTERM putative exosortase interaction domain